MLWISHCGRLIRASPEQVRPASLREYSQLPRDSHGQVVNERLNPDVGPRYSPSLAPEEAREQHGVETNGQPEVEVSPQPSQVGLEIIEPEQPPEIADGTAVPIPEGTDDELFSMEVSQEDLVKEFEIHFVGGPQKKLNEDNSLKRFPEEFAGIATSARKQRVEIRWNELSPDDKRMFEQAKNKEVQAWLDHQTVKRVTAGTLDPYRSCEVGGFLCGNHQNFKEDQDVPKHAW